MNKDTNVIMRESKKRRRKEEIIERRERGGDEDRGHTPVREATVHYQRTTYMIHFTLTTFNPGLRGDTGIGRAR